MNKLSALLLPCIASIASAQTPITSIPFEQYGDHMIIKVSVDDSEPLNFIFDTGSGLTVIDKDVAESLGLSGKKKNMGTSMEQIKHNKLAINGFVMEQNINIYAADLNHLEISLGRDIDGILGYDLMVHHTLHIDNVDSELDIYDHGTGPVTGDAIPFYMNISIPTITASVVLNNGEPLEGTFFVMTGAATTLDFNTPFANKNGIINKTGKHFSYLVKDISENETIHYEGHVQSFKFGNETIENLPIGISQANTGIQANADVSGIIGNELLHQFNITIDVPNKLLYFEPNHNYGGPFLINSAGIDIQLSKDKKSVLIHKVYEDSPASEVGVQINDELLAVNGKSVDELGFPAIKYLLSQKGESIVVKYSRGGDENEVTLQLRSLID